MLVRWWSFVFILLAVEVSAQNLELLTFQPWSQAQFRYVIPKFSDETESEAFRQFETAREMSPMVSQIVPENFSGLFRSFSNLTVVAPKGRILLLANDQHHHTNEDNDIARISRTYSQLSKQTFVLPVGTLVNLDESSQQRFRRLLTEHFGMVLPLGGPDIDLNSPRDQQELSIINEFRARADRYVLAICRGCQLIAADMGSTIIQDIPTEIGTQVDHQSPHSVRLQQTPTGQHAALIAPFVDRHQQLTVSSFHHQGFRSQGPLGTGLQIAAVAPDHVVEAFDLTSGRGVLVQYHPEYMQEPFAKQFFGEAAAQCERAL